MNKILTVLGVVICILLFVYIVLVFNTRSTETSLLTGFWKGSADFCDNAGLRLFLIHIGECSTFSNTRPGYILIENGEGLIINNPVIFNLSGGNSFSPKLCNSREYEVEIDWMGETGYDSFFPSIQTIHYYPECGKLVFTGDDGNNDEQIYAILYKDFSISDIAQSVPDTVTKEEDIIQ